MSAALPQTGREWDELKVEMRDRGAGDVDWRSGKTAVYVFNAGEEIAQIQREAYTMYMSENGLGPAAFPSLKQMEQEVVGYGLNLLNAPDGSRGSMTSGGTDSILMAVKTARDAARANGRAVERANLVLPFSAHPAFDKAARLMDLEVRRIPVIEGAWTADPAAMAGAVDENTIMMVGSCPNFPHGVIDPIAELGDVAERADVWLHVDACVGGYFAPFARMNGVDLPAFDFAVPPVRSISADLHKFGYAAKGASTVLFRREEDYRHMPFDERDWSGARMVTPTLAGTRPGGAIAAAWAVMNHLGVEGYRQLQAQVCDTRERIAEGVRALGFEVLGDPKLCLIAFRRADRDALQLWAKLRERGWFTSITTQPLSLHLMLSPKHADVADQYLADLAWACDAIEAEEVKPVEARYS